MALPCFASKACNGCMACYKARERVGRCIICNKDIRIGDDSLLTSSGLVCDDEDCLFEFAVTQGSGEDIKEYIRLHTEDFLYEYKDKLLNAVFGKETAKIDLLEFIGSDKMSYVEYWNSRNGYAILPSL